MEYFGNISPAHIVGELAAILKIKPSLIQNALSKSGALHSSGLLQIDKTPHLDIPDRMDTLEGFGGAIIEDDFETALSGYFHKSPVAKLRMGDFPHIEKDLSILRPFLKRSLKARMAGVNVLLYGLPGTGKTELVRMLAEDVGIKLFEVSSQDNDGNPADSDQRFRSYLLCQRLFAKTNNSVILFDEVEDVFPVDDFVFFGPHRRTGNNKAWTNRLLENNPVAAIWISNSVSQIDPAFVRRFDMVFEVPLPPRSIRKRMLEKHIGTLRVSDEWLQKMAENERLAPSHIEKAARVATLVSAKSRDLSEAVLERVIGNSHKALGYTDNSKYSGFSSKEYDLRFLNVDCELPSLMEALRNNGAARICLYGPPGSGKSAFVHYVGKQLERPVLLKRASDLLDCYLGQTEQKMADMFSQASAEKSILLLDEADSFLQDRARAHHSWEITQVNELLVQMESFAGIFFCATNLMQTLDSAVFRRFDLKVKFDYLTGGQALSMFLNYLREGSGMLTDHEAVPWKLKLAELRELTPGDFAVVKRRLNLMNKPIEALTLFEELKKECAVKPRVSKHAGFQVKVRE